MLLLLSFDALCHQLSIKTGNSSFIAEMGIGSRTSTSYILANSAPRKLNRYVFLVHIPAKSIVSSKVSVKPSSKI